MIDGNYVHVSELSVVSSGMAFWVYFASDTAVTMPGTTSTLDKDISVSSGWTMIGSPFDVINWSDVKVDGESAATSSKVETSLFAYNADGTYSATTTLRPWMGYFVKLNSAVTVTIPADGGGGGNQDQPTNVQAKECAYGTHTLLCLTWDAPAVPGDGYRVYVYHAAESFDLPYSGDRLIPVNRYTVGGLTPGEEYGVEVTSAVESGGLITKESEHSSRALDSTVANTGNQAVISFRAVRETGSSAGRVASRTSGGVAEGFEVVSDADLELKTSGGAIFATSTTDEFGWAEFASLATDTYTMDAVHDMGTPEEDDDIKLHKTNIEIAGGQVKELGDLTLAETGRIQGVVTLRDQSDHSLVDVGIPGTSFWAKTDSSGNYTIFYIPPGIWDISATKDGYTVETQENLVVVSKQTTAAAPMELIPNTGTIGGTVTLDGKSASNYGGVVASVQGTTLTTLTIADGSYTIEYVPPSSTHTVIFTADGYETIYENNVTVTIGATTTLDAVNLELALISLTVSPLNSIIAQGDTLQFHATGTKSNLAAFDYTGSVTWSVSDPSTGAIDAAGLFTASATDTGATDITAEADNGLVTSTTITVGIPPDITSITPAAGDNDDYTNVTIEGGGFVNGASARIGSVTPIISIAFISGTRLTGQIPFGMDRGAYDITVTNPDGLSDTLPAGFTVELPAPSILSVTPDNGMNTATKTIQITGATFVDEPLLAVAVGSTPCGGVTFINENTISADVPPGMLFGTYDVVVTNGDGKQGTLADGYRVTIPGVVVSMISPSEGINDSSTPVTISGAFFANGASAYIQKGFNSLALENLTVVSSATITATVPSSLPWNTYDIKVINADYTSGSLSDVFTVTLPAPVINGAAPLYMLNSVEQLVTATGTNFVNGASVYIGATLAADVNANAGGTEITFRAPTGIAPGTYDITITNPDSAARSDTLSSSFTVVALTGIVVDPGGLSIMQGATNQLKATCGFTDGTTNFQEICTGDVTWNSSNPSLGTISSGGLLTASSSGAGSFTLMAYKGVISSNDVSVTVFDPVYLFQDTGQNLGGGTVRWVFGADIENDGDMDFVAALYGSASKIWENDGTGTFTAGQDLNTAGNNSSLSVFAADINADGYIDIIEGNDTGQTDNVWLNNGSGTFISMPDYGASDTNSVFGADFDNDGDIDFAAGNDGQQDTLWMNSGAGVFSAGQTFDIGFNFTKNVFAADVNSDGFTDLVIINIHSSEIWINDGDGNGTFTKGSVLDDQFFLRGPVFAADMNGNGYIDIFGSGDSMDKVFLNDGSGTFTETGEEMIKGSGTNAVFGADVDNDGDTDIVGGKDSINVVWINDGNASFTELGQPMESNVTYSIFLADLNNDGSADIISAENGTEIWLGGNGIQANSQPDEPSYIEFGAQDLEADRQYDDVVMTWTGGSDIETPSALLTYNMRIGTSIGDYDIMSGVTSVGYGNIGATSSVILHNYPQGVYYYSIQAIDTGYRKSGWTTERSFVSGPMYTDSGQSLGLSVTTSVFGADMDGDGDIDIIEGIYSLGVASSTIWINNGGVFTDSGEDFAAIRTSSIFSADVDGDGDLDIIQGSAAQPTKIWANNGDGTLEFLGQNSIAGGTYSVFGADTDNDGDIDIIEGNNYGMANKVWENDGAGSFSDSGVSMGSDDTVSIFAADMNGDGYIDIVEGSQYFLNTIWMNSGSGTFPTTKTTVDAQGTCAVFGADVDSDGDVDIIEGTEVASSDPGTRIHKNNGTGTVTKTGQNLTDNDTRSEFAVDVDNDGDVDIIEGNFGSNRLWLNDGTGAFTDSGMKMGTSQTTSVFAADIDGDGDVDYIEGNENEPNRVWLLAQVPANTAPSVPNPLTTFIAGNDATPAWNVSSDAESTANAITYEISLATSPGIAATSLSSPIPGNSGVTLSHYWNNMPGGTYYWAVRAVDSGYMQSDWSAEQNFTIP